jgi:hypothetical protein
MGVSELCKTPAQESPSQHSGGVRGAASIGVRHGDGHGDPPQTESVKLVRGFVSICKPLANLV